ncbi:hypothetical protein XMM379_002776 [Aliiroseovarius sp. xm-m-379]|uniref:Uncharacterized protein n=1 Tax=Aliiroseovarius crassostreae TaxID=154981 RepID=A0A0P7JKI4_9RHOB|nr:MULTISPECIES: hypothetical protein [Aliiroseovarius]KPN61609.1 hypothetical protein AKJ29_03060 [Aliiroseovarius crassostreae]NRP26070.1 hypothetical protein [Aliiroseovarius sp. xm-m-379]NRP30437.1 hypothetical protein [Aliiroseovarius sp. xm-m-314]NRP34869.1 hypothetical protein [Aliiroseovarius sp. xm-a-104]NRP49995.1 hypothetical protein [Aliiroseovarius sp. xm-m-354]
MSDPFKSRSPGLNGPATDLLPVVPSDSVDLDTVAIALLVETGGTVSFVTQSGAVRTVTLGDQTILPVGTRRVNATGTTASGIHAFIVG